MSFNQTSLFFTVAEVSVILRLSTITVYKYIRENKIDAIEFGGHYRIAHSSLDKFIRNHKVRVPAKNPELEVSK